MITAENIKTMAAQIVAFWQTVEGCAVCESSPEPFRATVEHLFGDWEQVHGSALVDGAENEEWPYGPEAYGCLIDAVEQLDA